MGLCRHWRVSFAVASSSSPLTPSSIFTFWRFFIQVPLTDHEMEITYRINNGQALNFYVPGRNQNLRWAAHSVSWTVISFSHHSLIWSLQCNGFSAGINPDNFRGPGFQSGYDPVWVDLLSHHANTPFHALVGGGDQLYCDVLLREPEMQDWAAKMKPEERKQYPLTDEIRICIDRFLFNHYCQSFRRGAFARANSSMSVTSQFMLSLHWTYFQSNGQYVWYVKCSSSYTMGAHVSWCLDDHGKSCLDLRV